MKTLLYALLFTTLMVGCAKDKEDNTLPKSREELLTAHTWIYQEYWSQLNTSVQRLSYQRGRAQNELDLSRCQLTFRKDGTVEEIDKDGQLVPGTWVLDTTELYNDEYVRIANVKDTITYSIRDLTADKFSYYVRWYNYWTNCGVLIPSP